MATKKMAAKKMVAKKASPMKQGLPPGAEVTGRYDQRVTRGQRNFAAQGSKFGAHAGISINSDLQATANQFNRRYADTQDGYTEVYGYGEGGKEQRIFRGRTGMKATDDFVAESQRKVKEVNSRRTNNANTYNAMQGPTSNLSNPDVLEKAIGFGNVKMNTRTGQSPTRQTSSMGKKSSKAAASKKATTPAKMKKC
jgi:hypothetical protein